VNREDQPALARARADNAPAEPEASAAKSAYALVANILIVDDDPRNLLALKEILADLGQNVVTASSGEDALRHVLKTDFAVILLDARMPGMDGFETARLIGRRERSRHTPILFLTGAFEDMNSMFQGYESGAVDYIVKPLVPEVLRSKISIFIDLYFNHAVLSREIAERKQIEAELRTSEESLRALAVHLQSVREEERTRIAREIHDELGQTLTGLKMDLTSLAKRLPEQQKDLGKKVKSMFQLIDSTIHSVRRISSGLRPQVLDELGLVAAVKWQATEFQKRTGIRCRIDLPADGVQLREEQSTAVFRIFQEVLTNVARHAKATRVGIDFQVSEDRLVLKIEDNGKGMRETDRRRPSRLGLMGMRERAVLFGGDFEIGSEPGKGTLVTLSMPIRREISS
jgi:signal transduction histidine kinase